MDLEAESRIKSSFLKVKEHMKALEDEIRANREFIIEQNSQIKAQNERILLLLDKIQALDTNKNKTISIDFRENEVISTQDKVNSPLKNEVSIGNDGVSLNGYSLPNYSLPRYSLDVHKIKEELPNIIGRLSRQEFLTFLTVYQQEEQSGKVTYESIAEELNISAGCVRTYISGLIKKGIPLLKTKYNNKVIILSIPVEIRGLNMKKKLINVFYNQDPTQRKLGDEF